MAQMLRHQIDLVEDISGLSPRTLEFFRTIPISVNDVACLTPGKDQDGKDIEDPKALLNDACYGPASPEGSHNLTHGSVWTATRRAGSIPIRWRSARTPTSASSWFARSC